MKGGHPVGVPHNHHSGRPYSGTNVFMLWLEMMTRPDWWEAPKFLTFNQALDLGGNVKEGEKGLPIYYMSTFKKTKENDEGEDETYRGSFLKRYTVFHVSQCENLRPRAVDIAAVVEPLMQDDMKEFYACVGAKTRHGGNQAFYAPAPDVIQMPGMKQFEDEARYHATRLHEITHWTGAPHRLERLKSLRYGDQNYAFEELVAELGAALLCAELGVEGQLRHADYMGHWIKLLGEHEKAFFSAASKASKAVEFLRELCITERHQEAAQ